MSYSKQRNQHMTEYAEDKPVMRSVALSSLSSSANGPALHFASPSTIKTSFRQSPLEAKKQSVLQQQQKSVVAPTNASSWELSDEDVPVVPFWFCMSDTINSRNTIVLPHSCQHALDQLCTFMRLKSIVCHFNANEARLDCNTQSRLHFVINIWKQHEKSNATADSKHQLLLSLQRLQGDHLEMHRIQSEMFKFLQGGPKPTATLITGQRRNSCPAQFMAISPNVRNMFAAAAQVALEEDDSDMSDDGEDVDMDVMATREAKEGISICKGLLMNPCKDKQRMGMESLIMMSGGDNIDAGSNNSVNSSNNQSVLEVVKELTSGTSTLASLLQSLLNDESGKDCMDSELDDHFEYEEGYNGAVMHRLVAQVTTNVLEYCAKNKHVQQCNSESPFWSSLTNAMVHDLQNAHDRPHDAAAAARVLTLMHSTSGVSSSLNADVPMLLKAYKYGQQHHSKLEQECQQLLKHVGGNNEESSMITC